MINQPNSMNQYQISQTMKEHALHTNNKFQFGPNSTTGHGGFGDQNN